MRTIIGVAVGTVIAWLTIVAAAIAYILEHIFAISLSAGIAVAVMLAGRLLRRRHQTGAFDRPRELVSGPVPNSRYSGHRAPVAIRAAGRPLSPSLHPHRKVLR